jgi:ABC-type Mn2+/Zn2+ transport system permease subunit
MPLFLEYLRLLHNAMIVGPLLAAVCSLLSVFVVLRGMAMIGEGVAHAGVGGLGVALLSGLMLSFLDNSVGQLVITGLFCTATALFIGYISHGKHVSEDSAIGICLAAAVAVGIVALTIRHYLHGASGTPPSLEDMLFGSINTIGPNDVYATLVLAIAVFAIVFSMYRAFVYTALDEEMARINGVPVALINTLLLMMVSMVIVLAMRMVGLMMINALMIIPGATARLLSRSFGRVVLISLAVGVLGVTGSLLLAITLALNPPLDRIPTGPIMVLTLFSLFITSWLYRKLVKRKLHPVEDRTIALPSHD